MGYPSLEVFTTFFEMGEKNAKTLLIGCSGSVACIKIPEILDLLQRRFPEMKIVLIPTVRAGHFLPKDRTDHNLNAPFLQPCTISIVDPLQCGSEDLETLTERAVAFLIAPLGANLMAKLANPCLLQSSNLERALEHFFERRSGKALPILLAPAMNSMMWNSSVTEKNMETIRLRLTSLRFVEKQVPVILFRHRETATGFGPMASPTDIADSLENVICGRRINTQKDSITAAQVPNLRMISPTRHQPPETDEAPACSANVPLYRSSYSRDAPGYRCCLDMLIREHKDELHMLIGASNISDISSVVQSAKTPADFKTDIYKRFLNKFMADLQKANKEQNMSDHNTESKNLLECRTVLKYIITDGSVDFNPQILESGQNIMNMEFLSDSDEWRVWGKREDPVLHILLRQWADGMLLLNPTELFLQKIAAGVCDDLLTCVIRAWDYSKDVIFALFNEEGRSVLEKVTPQQNEEFRQRGIQLIWMTES